MDDILAAKRANVQADTFAWGREVTPSRPPPNSKSVEFGGGVHNLAQVGQRFRTVLVTY